MALFTAARRSFYGFHKFTMTSRLVKFSTKANPSSAKGHNLPEDTHSVDLAMQNASVRFMTSFGSHGFRPDSIAISRVKKYISCNKVFMAFESIETCLNDGSTLDINIFNELLKASMWRIKELIRKFNITKNAETNEWMIRMYVKFNNFDAAEQLINDMLNINSMPTATMFNIIIAEYMRQKNFCQGVMLFEKMIKAGIKPDANSFRIMIENCKTETSIQKYKMVFENLGVQPSKFVFMALIRAYGCCQLYVKAKDVLLDNRIHSRDYDDIKNELVVTLASNGAMADALKLHHELKHFTRI